MWREKFYQIHSKFPSLENDCHKPLLLGVGSGNITPDDSIQVTGCLHFV